MICNGVELNAKSIEHIVIETDLATNWKNDVPVLSTPVLLWLGEVAAMKVLEGAVPIENISVGVSHNVKHLAPTPVGFKLVITATPIEVSGRIISFEVKAHDGIEIVLSGVHQRAIIDKKTFLDKLQSKVEAVL